MSSDRFFPGMTTEVDRPIISGDRLLPLRWAAGDDSLTDKWDASSREQSPVPQINFPTGQLKKTPLCLINTHVCNRGLFLQISVKCNQNGPDDTENTILPLFTGQLVLLISLWWVNCVCVHTDDLPGWRRWRGQFWGDLKVTGNNKIYYFTPNLFH